MAFNHLMQIITSNISKFFPDNSSVIELGNQRFKYNPKIIDFINNEQNLNIRKPVKYVWEYYEDLGFVDYKSIDVNTELKAIDMDLNYNLLDKYNFKETFSLVTNNGTGEHIFDQRTVFENMHNLCKVNGIMLNILPLSPWLNHGFYNYNPNLFRDIVASNSYQWILMAIGRNSGEMIQQIPIEKNDSWGFYDQSPPKNPKSELEKTVENIQGQSPNFHNVSLITCYKKINNESFQIPMQGRYVNDMNHHIKIHYNENNIDTKQKNHHSANY
jgi:hypothetical protein